MRHEREITYWAKHPDGTEVWAKSRGGTFCKTGFPAWLPEDVYIVDNEWTELRKMNYFGFTIEETLDNGKTWEDLPEDWWKNDFYNLDFEYVTPEIFRVKEKNTVIDKESVLMKRVKDGAVICWVSNTTSTFNRVAIIVSSEYKSKDKIIYEDSLGNYWNNAVPVTPEELFELKDIR